MKRGKSRDVALMGLLFALVLTLSFLENVLAGVLLLPPGVKPGLANIVVLFCLLCRTGREAAALVLLKALFSLLTRGVLAASLSAVGGFSSLLLMSLFLCLKNKPSVLTLSIVGALSHNFSQLFLFSLLFGTHYVWTYAPILLISALLAACLTAFLLKSLLPSLQKMGLSKKYTKEKEVEREKNDL